mmetsp:Transcript_36466/g.47050  ORF Transcript_36466/g.47050 Transcript_36466/m.47050 type:complete len:142 (+) Transcript_36466:319-744(+)|eukprot:CAMPEP_0114359250 /NCGR_PEP_ID=MMETSP0101-20121206/22870_1 /TAXON_ID=38822 ORGANISM="Pteridomonas danica, Strain PT" /NCGR_SAMPLE_ID=MMETSP0101 /ASSEMBLY_ACC=CAM_ASM_000211 /LENGTH=141 /DNA_ID=CAMNT_0001502687 /DNA_START=180 /DNA_END=605 /DNA_ORIENTATION=+
MCSFSEEGEDYCLSTRRRQEYICRNNEDEEGGGDSAIPRSIGTEGGSMRNHHVLFHSCDSTPDDDVTAVIWFEVWMVVIGALSIWGVYVQKSRHLTLYERRGKTKSFRIQDAALDRTESASSSDSSSTMEKSTLRRGRSSA